MLAQEGKAIGIAGPPTPEFAKRAGLNPILRLAIGALSRRIRSQAARAGVQYEFLFMESSGDQLRRIAELVDAGVIRPVVG
ncbi:zinc-binding dehydrogenase, partial [Bacillus sp. SIMBA_005]|uniref:zinc-binding dehydrogenase n=1 Tax=Bacillus sp. SIMBA_005 TaxID=3085754 RepID=UPI003979FB08